LAVNVARGDGERASTPAITGFLEGIYSFITNVSVDCNMGGFHIKKLPQKRTV